MTEIYAEIEVTEAWWQKHEKDLAETYTERAYDDGGQKYGQTRYILRFGPFKLPRHEDRREDKLAELEALMDFIVGDHIASYKLTSKPF